MKKEKTVQEKPEVGGKIKEIEEKEETKLKPASEQLFNIVMQANVMGHNGIRITGVLVGEVVDGNQKVVFTVIEPPKIPVIATPNQIAIPKLQIVKPEKY